MKLDLLKASLEAAPLMRRGEYAYFIHQLTDSIPPIEPRLLAEVCEAIKERADLDVDYIVTMEAMGIHVSAVLSQITGLPFNIIRKRQYGLPGEIELNQRTGYGGSKMYLNSVRRGDVVAIVDAVVSTGGTLIATIEALRAGGAVIKDAVCVIERGGGVEAVRKATGFKVKTLAKIDVGERVTVTGTLD